MPDTVIFGDSMRQPAVRHEVPVAIHDPFLFVETVDRRVVVATTPELERLAALSGIEVHTIEEYGLATLFRAGVRGHEAIHEAYASAVQELGVTAAIVPDTTPMEFGERLRRRGISLTVDRDYFVARRRLKSDVELAGIRRAQGAAEAGMRTAVDMLRDRHRWPLTSGEVKTSIARVFADHGCVGETFVVSHGPQSANGHERGSGAFSLSEPILIDLGPRDIESGCFADMTRTFVCGEPPSELVEWYEIVLRVLRAATVEAGPGVAGRALYDLTCDIFEQNGYETNRSAGPGSG